MRKAVLVLAALAPGRAMAQDSFADAFWDVSARSGFDFSSGYYGAAKPTEILAVPLSLENLQGSHEPRAEAMVSVFDSGFILGDGVWEGLRMVKGGVPFLHAGQGDAAGLCPSCAARPPACDAWTPVMFRS